MMQYSASDVRWMKLAVHEARHAEGRVGENPPVGCVLTDAENRLIASSHTQPGGRPHAEASALSRVADAGQQDRLKGGTAYVTLEPCAHHGKSPPCADALIRSGLSHVVYAVSDPDPRVSGAGAQMLKDAGIDVRSGLLSSQAEQVMAGFLMRIKTSRPYISSKIATSCDGFISHTHDSPTKLTGAVSQRFVHDLRSRSDALLTGAGTVLADNPELTVRMAADSADTPLRVVVDSHLSCPPELALFRAASHHRVMVVHLSSASEERGEALRATGAELVSLEPEQGKISLDQVFALLGQRQVNHVMVEAGARLNYALFSEGFVDRLIWLKSPHRLSQGVAMCSQDVQPTAIVDFHLPKAYRQRAQFILDGDEVSISDREPVQAL